MMNLSRLGNGTREGNKFYERYVLHPTMTLPINSFRDSNHPKAHHTYFLKRFGLSSYLYCRIGSEELLKVTNSHVYAL